MAPRLLEARANIFNNFDLRKVFLIIVNKFESLRFRQTLDFGFPDPRRDQEPQPPLVGFGVCHQLGLVKLIHSTKIAPPYSFQSTDFGAHPLDPVSRFSVSRPILTGREWNLATSMGKPLYNLL
jgi:hypothetical protein